MKLPFLNFLSKQEKREYFLALLLRDESVRAVVFEESAGQMQIMGIGEEKLTSPLEEITAEKLLETLDKTIGIAESHLPNNIQTHKTIFGLKADWVDAANIKKDRLPLLKQICDELELSPIGFLVFSEAIAHLLQKQEGAPVSAILAELGEVTLTLTLIRAGRLIEVKQAPAEEPLAKAVDTLLQHFTNVEILPSRIILLDSQKRPRLSQSFISHQWSKTLPFLHVPQITMLDDGFDTQAILYGTASQMGFVMEQLPKSRIVTKTEHRDDAEKEEEHIKMEETMDEDAPVEEKEAEEKEEDKEKHEETEKEEHSPTATESFGFVTGKDVLEEAPKHPHAMPSHHGDNFISKDEVEHETFGQIPEDVKEREEGFKSSLLPFGANGTFLSEGVRKAGKQLQKVKWQSIGDTIKGVSGLFSSSTGPRSISKGFPFLFLIPIIFLIILGGLLWYIFGLRATVTLVINPKVVDASDNATFSSTASTDLSKNLIGGQAVTVSEDGSVSTDATGKKDVGDKAKGTVTLYNLSDSSKTYQAGTTITATSGLKFTLDKDVTVASGSSDPINPVAGKQNIDVTAGDIGTEYNLPSGTKFSVSGNVSVAGKNDNAFSGGTKKSVTVISKNDIAKLVDDLTNKLQDKAKNDLQQKADGSKGILSVFLKTELTQEKLSGQVNDEANSVSLDGAITYTGLAYTKSDMDNLAKTLLKDKLSGGKLSDKGITVDVKDPTVKNGAITGSITVKAGLVPSVDTASIQKQIAGKSFASVEQALNSINQLSEVRIKLSPNLFFLPKMLPRISSRITVTTETNE